MRADLFEEFSPLCPVCRTEEEAYRVGPMPGLAWPEDGLDAGVLRCLNPDCVHEFPVFDGVPILVSNVASVLESQSLSLLGREDLSEDLCNLVGDCLDPASPYNALRQHLSCYGWDHFGEYDPDPPPTPMAAMPGSITRLLEAGLALLESGCEPGTGTHALDLGCGVGRTVFDLTAMGATVLGVDLYFGMLKAARRTLATGRFSYPLRRSGLVFEHREVDVPFARDARAMFLLGDAVAPPLRDHSFDLITSLNLLDTVLDPLGHLKAIHRLLGPGGQAIVATPYDWSGAATPVSSWIGGHSSRSRHRGDGPGVLRHLLEKTDALGGLRITAEADDVPWHVRMHDRGLMEYRVHLFTLMLDATA